MIERRRVRTFLAVIDGSPEQAAALLYAARRAAAIGGQVALLYVIEPHEIFPWAAVERSIDAGQEEAARRALQAHVAQVQAVCGRQPVLYIRRGRRREALLELIETEPSLSQLVLGAGSKGPGPLIDFLASAKGVGRLKIPMVVVPPGYDGRGES